MPKVVHGADGRAEQHVDGNDAGDVDQPPLPKSAQYLPLAIKERQLRADEAKDCCGSAGGQGRRKGKAHHIAGYARQQVNYQEAGMTIDRLDLRAKHIECITVECDMPYIDVKEHWRDQPPVLAHHDEGVDLSPQRHERCRVVRAAHERLDDKHHDVDPQQPPYQQGPGQRQSESHRLGRRRFKGAHSFTTRWWVRQCPRGRLPARRPPLDQRSLGG